MRDLSTLPIDSINVGDIEALVGVEESPSLEFKRSLPTTDGRPDRWMSDQSKIGGYARDQIAKEIVAFANAYGGVVIIGVDETDDKPARAKGIFESPIPRVAECAERLARALRDIIDPPLHNLEAVGISSSGGAGIILLRVGPSPSAPHGYGSPTAAYVRRGSDSMPVTMRDLQSMFFERRTRLERVRVRREEFRSAGDNILFQWTGGLLRRPYDDGVFQLADKGMFFRCTCVPVEDFAIDNFPDAFLQAPDASLPRPGVLPNGDLIQLPNNKFEWRRRYRAVEYTSNAGDRRLWQATIAADGAVNLISIIQPSERGSIFLHTYAATILQAMVLSEWMRRWSGRAAIEYVLDAVFFRHGPLRFYESDPQVNLGESSLIPWETGRIGPYSIGGLDGLKPALDSIEREVWDLFQARRGLPLQYDLERVLQSTGLN
jgi:hypothetical protein